MEVVEAVEVVEERHHPGLEEQDMERLSLHMWTTNYTARVLTSVAVISPRYKLEKYKELIRACDCRTTLLVRRQVTVE